MSIIDSGRQWIMHGLAWLLAWLRRAGACLVSPGCWRRNAASFCRAAWRWARVLWVSRIAAISALGGGALLAGTAQARDLFADLGLSTLQWGLFFLLLFTWALIVHASARRALLNDDWVADAHCPGALGDLRRAELRALYHDPALLIPRLLGLAVFGWVVLAIHRAHANLEAAKAGLVEAAEAVRLADRLWIATIATAAVYLLAVWGRRPLRARLLTAAGQAGGEEPILLASLLPVPLRPAFFQFDDLRDVWRLILASLAVAVTTAFVLAISAPHAVSETLPRVMMAPLLFGGIVLALGEIAMWSHRKNTPFLLALVLISAALLLFVDGYHDVRTLKPDGVAVSPATGETRQIGLSEAVSRWRIANDCSTESGRTCPRPILIAGSGGASRAAFLTATVVGALIDVGTDTVGRAQYDNVRNRIFAMSTVSGSSLGAVVMRAAMSDAVERGRPDAPPCQARAEQLAWFRGIRGSAETRAGLLREYANPTYSWRDCFQLLLAGDFLSPVLIGVAYRDAFPSVDPITRKAYWVDRAALLEQAFERRYHAITRDEAPANCPDTEGKGLCRRFGWHPAPERAKAWIPLLFINGTSVSTGRRIIVSDVPMGDRYDGEQNEDQTLLPFAYDLNDFGRMPLPDDPDPKHVLAQAGKAEAIPEERPIDIRLSTAATMSARFPLISPQGNLRDRTGNLRDKVVDGGYFENDGLATIADVAAALRYHFKLDPVVIRIVNEPTKSEKVERPRKDRPPIPDEAERTPFDGFLSILRTLTATRSGHEDGHEAYLTSVLGAGESENRPAVRGKDRLYEIRVYELIPDDSGGEQAKQVVNPESNPLCRQFITTRTKMEFVSMSWWMSHPVQAYLDAQLCVRANWHRLECELREGRARHGGNCPKQDF
ncbi:MAG: hypothetical protein GEU91_08045 [Rhizobiales bacterium]|nr:hypothetical protein [Hyphomicrobiales bacterium]